MYLLVPCAAPRLQAPGSDMGLMMLLGDAPGRIRTFGVVFRAPGTLWAKMPPEETGVPSALNVDLQTGRVSQW